MLSLPPAIFFDACDLVNPLAIATAWGYRYAIHHLVSEFGMLSPYGECCLPTYCSCTKIFRIEGAVDFHKRSVQVQKRAACRCLLFSCFPFFCGKSRVCLCYEDGKVSGSVYFKRRRSELRQDTHVPLEIAMSGITLSLLGRNTSVICLCFCDFSVIR